MNTKIEATHLQRGATIYLRQSTMKQVAEHRESTLRQYGLRERAIALGFSPESVSVVDEDLGQSGTSTESRTGFQRLAEDVAHGRTGAIVALEVSRLARSSADWHRLLELCGLANVLIVDEQAVYNPRDHNDRLLLGLKGTMSEAELYWMRLRLDGGKLSKAQRGQYSFLAAPGYVWDDVNLCFRLDPDEQVQRAVRLVFEEFRARRSAYGVCHALGRQGVQLPLREVGSRKVVWSAPKQSAINYMLHNPAYAGAYVYGRTEQRQALVDGKVRRHYKKKLEAKDWKVFLKDRHPGYISWEVFMDNQRQLEENRLGNANPGRRGAAREGVALLQGLVLCGRCGRRMTVHYRHGNRSRGYYQCVPNQRWAVPRCWSVAASEIDKAVAQEFLRVVTPPQIELALAGTREVEHQATEVDRLWKLRMERLHYEARVAERRYKAVDPDNRVVARTLETEWNEKLVEIDSAKREYQRQRETARLEMSDDDRAKVLKLASDLPALWNAPTTTITERKNLLRTAIQEVTLHPVDVPERTTRVHLLWEGGATTELIVPRRDKHTANTTSQEVLDVVKDLCAGGQKDCDIAATLNRRGLARKSGKPWDVVAVKRIRQSRGLDLAGADHAPERRADGLYSLRGVAARLGVTPGVVYGWRRDGLLEPAAGGGIGHDLWFRLDAATVKGLQADKNHHLK